MNILYIAYSCDPFNGSEDKIGWNIPVESAKINDNIFVITKMEHKVVIEKYLEETHISNIKFYFVDIPKFYKRIFKSFLYSARLNIWHKRAVNIAKQICFENKIDIIHQITPVEFRSIGDYNKIPNIKFIVGPIGGGEFVPQGLKEYIDGHKVVEIVRVIVNAYYKLKFCKKLKKIDYISFANVETKKYLTNEREYDVFSEIGIDKKEIVSEKISNSDKMVFLVSGRLIYRKGHRFLLDALELLPKNLSYEVRIIGDGNEFSKLQNIISMSSNLKNNVYLIGKLKYEQMYNEYKNADAFIMPSIRETTGTVIIEALSNGLPVITINKFGAKNIVNANNGYLYEGETKNELINGLKEEIQHCIENNVEVKEKSREAISTAHMFTWENKVKKYQDIYMKLL